MPKLTRKQKWGAGIASSIALVLGALAAAEGGYVFHPSDPGGETNHGITKNTARANGYTGSMRALTKEEAEDIYVREYMEKPGFILVMKTDACVAQEAIDTGVNAGPAKAALWLQESLNHLNSRGRDYPDIAEDGNVGQQTVNAINALRRRRGPALTTELLVKLMDAKQAAHYMRLFGKNSKFEDFAVGWVRTRIGNVDLKTCK